MLISTFHKIIQQKNEHKTDMQWFEFIGLKWFA